MNELSQPTASRLSVVILTDVSWNLLSEARIRRLDEIGFQWAGARERRTGET